ncbi:cytochrome P450 [Choiromyces venosus 120613-1]|uniref:Cytochrome P450 n=1 Tax=Choiromyces venosus 120613-1 TaxID=1336337 RepID=A0A3N4J623_9PEZI|nr:cytochrome P450 [Choiromyces venosus 120613-1]
MTKDYAEAGKEMDYAYWSQFFAYDIGFGKPSGFVKTASDVHGLIEAFHGAAKAIGLMARCEKMKDILRSEFATKYIIPDINKESRLGRIIVTCRGENFYGESASQIDLMQHLLQAKLPGDSPLPIQDTKAELLILMFAGSDTTAATMRHLLLYALRNPKVYTRLMEEMDTFVATHPPFDVIPYDDAQSLPYFTACLRETMRIAPSTPIGMPRHRRGGITLPEPDGRYIPEHIKLICDSFVTQKDKSVYGPNTHEFNPDRWLGKGNEEKVREFEKYDLHFGGGARVCLGENIAYL